MRIAFLIPVALLSGCAANAVPAFEDLSVASYSTGEPGRNASKDSAGCELEAEKARTMYNYGGLAGLAAYHESRNRAYDACMRMKGYKRKA